jgi:hypothetical protein
MARSSPPFFKHDAAEKSSQRYGRNMTRRRVLGAVGLIVALAACGPDASTDAPTSVSSTAGSLPGATASTPAVADFGANYVGQPVAFWFWAPY